MCRFAGRKSPWIFSFFSLDPRRSRVQSWVQALAFVVAVILLVLDSGVTPAHAELHEGDGYVSGGDGGWDFSAFEFVPAYGTEDLSLHVVLATALGGFFLASQGGIQFAPLDASFDSLSVAPTEGYAQTVPGFQWTNYFVRTREGQYAKVRMLQSSGAFWDFHYVYQDDGTPSLKEPVAVRPTTWGAVNALYR